MSKLCKNLISAVLAAHIIIISSVPVVGVSSYYTPPSLDGQESKTVTYLYDGVTRTDYVLSNASRYNLSEDGQNYYYFTFDESFVCCNEELYDETVLNGGSLYNYIEYIDAGNNVYYYMDDNFIMIEAESIPNGAKVAMMMIRAWAKC